MAAAEGGALGGLLRSLHRLEPLSHEEEARLAELVQAGDQAALDRLVRHNMRFVVSVLKETPAWRYGPVPLEDLVGIGNEALLRAARRWVPKNGARLATYAKPFILRGLQRSLDNEWSMIRVPVNVAEELRRLRYADRALQQAAGREPTPEEVSRATGLTRARIARLRPLLTRDPISLDALDQDKLGEEADE